ncbi:multicopper oxidase domain-containing protein [Kyrpidia spormannii]
MPFIAFTADTPGQWMFHCHILDRPHCQPQ